MDVMNEWIGKWVRPWAGENVVGHVIAVEGSNLVCQSVGGRKFLVSLHDVYQGRIAEIGLTLRPLAEPIRRSA